MKYRCRTCGYENNSKDKMYEHLNESSEEDKVYQENYDEECCEFYEIKK